MSGEASSPQSEGPQGDLSGCRAPVLVAVQLFGGVVAVGALMMLYNQRAHLTPLLLISDLFALAYGAGLILAVGRDTRRGLRVALAMLLGLAASARRGGGGAIAVLVVCLCLAAALAVLLWIEGLPSSDAAPGGYRPTVSFYSEAANVAAGAFMVCLFIAASSAIAEAYLPFGPRPTFEVRKAQRLVVLTGGLYPATAWTLRNVLDTAQGVTTVVLESPGGLVTEGEALSELISTRGLNTRVDRECLSACTFALLGGTERSADPGAKIGFHASRKIPGGKPEIPAPTPEEVRALYRRFGASRDFAEKVAATPSDSMWYPSREELVAEGILSDPALTAPASSASAAHSRDQVAIALRTAPTLDALAAKYPEDFRQLVDKAWAKVQAAASDAEIRAVIRERIDFLADRAIVDAPDSLVLDYGALTFEQAEALRATSATGCLQVLFPTRKPGSLPPAFRARKEQVLGRIFLSHDTAGRATRATWKSGGRAAVRLALTQLPQAQQEALGSPEIGLAYPARVCEAGIAIAQALGKLPPGERAQSLRALFGTGEALLRPDGDITVEKTVVATTTVKKIVLGRAISRRRSVVQPTTRFAMQDTFAVLVTVDGGDEPVTIVARWTHQPSDLVAKDTVILQPPLPSVAQFYLWCPGDGWSGGSYKVEITMDGKRVGSRTFEVPPWGAP